uniref:Amidohydro-rel domain-containing protein n=1 Tax=Angiostrongylus cantonensis TaxID=6313 RepID=A0A0K0DHT9_ANGCA
LLVPAEQQEDIFTSQTSNEFQQTDNMGNDWNESKDNVIAMPTISEEEKQRMMDSEPGPDIGDDEELLSAGDTVTDLDSPPMTEQVANERNTKAESDDGCAADVRDAEESCSDEASVGVGGGDGMSLIIRGAQVVNDDSVFFADVIVQDGVIRNVGPSLEIPADAEIVEAAGKMLFPAGIDAYTYFTALDSADDLATSCKAAVAGGTATVIDVVSPKAGESLTSSLSRVKDGLSSSLCNVGFSVSALMKVDSVRKEMEKVVAEGVNSFIIDVEGDDILEHCRTLGVLARILPENRTIVPYLEKKILELGITGPEGFLQSRPEELESERVSKLCVLSQLSNCPVSILSVSSAESVSAMERARCSGALAHVEIASAAVVSNGTHYFNKCLKHAAAHMTEVPLRTEGCNKLVSALASQPLAVCTSGHRAVSSGNRTSARDFTTMPKGTVGVEERMCAVWEKAVRTGRIDPMRFVAVTSTNAAKMFNLYPKKGRIAVGADADLVLWDASGRWKLSSAERQSSVDISIYEGMTVHALVTIVGGQIVWKDGKIQEAKGTFVPLLPQSPYLFSVVQQRDKVFVIEFKLFLSTTRFSGGDHKPPATRVRNPPGGRSTGFW